MKINLLSDFESNIIKKFSKFILKFNNSQEFIDYLKKNNFKISASGLDSWLPFKYHKYIEKRLVYGFKLKILIDKSFKLLSFFNYGTIYLQNDKTKIMLYPLDKFIRRIDIWGELKNINIELLFQEIEKSGNFYLFLLEGEGIDNLGIGYFYITRLFPFA